MGKLAFVDLTDGDLKVMETDPGMLRRFLGGRGLAPEPEHAGLKCLPKTFMGLRLRHLARRFLPARLCRLCRC